MVDRPVAQLIEVGGHPFPVLASPGTEAAAVAAASRCERAHRYLTGLLGTSPRIRVLVLGEGDWDRHAAFPLYGMPHYTDERTLVIAGEETDFWRAVVPADDALTPTARRQLREVYGTRDGALRLSGFFDLLAVHELAHLFHLQAGREFPRLWLMELYCNLCLHAYTARTEPDSLPALETFPAAVVASGHEGLAHHTLADFERLYVEVGPVNYGWYQSELHAAAKRAFDHGGEDVARRFWDLVPLVASDAPVGELTAALGRVHPEVARTLTEWPPTAFPDVEEGRIARELITGAREGNDAR